MFAPILSLASGFLVRLLLLLSAICVVAATEYSGDAKDGLSLDLSDTLKSTKFSPELASTGDIDELNLERRVSNMIAMQRRLTNASPLLNFTGFLALDQGGNALPPVVSSAACCQPLAYNTPTKYLRILAGLRYKLTLVSTLSNLATDNNKAMLRLLADVAHVNSDCDTLEAITNFAGEFSILDGKGAAFTALADRNVWFEARVPYAGLYGLCYTLNGDEPEPTWFALADVTLHGFGTTQEKTRYFCPQELNQTCTITVNLPQLAARLMLLTAAGRCGYDGGVPSLQPFQRKTSTTTLVGGGSAADHSFGRYLWPLDTAGATLTLRICFCDAYEYDVASDGAGPCLSSGATDFPQALGYLYLVSVFTSPVLLYPGLPFTLHIRCGEFQQGECDATYAVRMRFIDVGPDGTFGEAGVTDSCRSFFQSGSYLEPLNCHEGNVLDCDFEPSVISQGVPAWYFIRVQGQVINGLVQAQTLGVCYCLGLSDCQHSEDWFRAGSVVINPIVVSPEPLVMGVATTLQLSAPGGAWTVGAGSGSQALKIIHMPNSSAAEVSGINCSSSRQRPETLNNFQCSYLLECTPPSSTSSTGPLWTNVAALKAGYYAMCYCDYACEQPDRWNFVKRHLVAGPEMVFAGSPTQAMNIYAGRTFALTLLGHGFSTFDRLIFLDYDTICGTAPQIPQLHFQESLEPVLTSSESAGIITSIQPTFQEDGMTLDGLLVAMAAAHGLSIDDRIYFSNVTVQPIGKTCKAVYSPALDADISHCVEVLTSYHSRILAIPSSTQIVLDIELSAEECATLELSWASWHRTSQEHFFDLYAERHSQGLYRVCWGISPDSHEDYLAEAGILTVLKPRPFPSALHLTSIAPGAEAPSIIAFQLGNRIAYSTAEGPMSFIIGFRNTTRFRHFFEAGLEGMPQEIPREQATQTVCGMLFRELWSSSEDGFPQPQGCFYKESNNEYGMIFPEKSGFRPGYQYQVVMNTVVSGGLVSEHHWQTARFALPRYPYAPNEFRHTAPDTFGDVGPVSTTLSCKVACSKSLECNVAIFRANTDRHCLLADFSRRADPFEVKTTPEIDGDLTMFMLDRLNRTHSDFAYNGHLTSTTNVALDLWSMDDLVKRPFEVVEASEAVVEEVVGLAPTAVDPRWHLDDGFKVISEDSSIADGSPLLLRPEEPLLLLRIRAAPGAPIEPGSAIRLFFWPLTQWQLPTKCLVECMPYDPLMRCSRPGCQASAVVNAPWVASRNTLMVHLAKDMTPITNSVTHTLKIQGRYLRIPSSGFMPTKFAAEVRGASSVSAFQPTVDYTTSTGLLPYAALTASTSVLALDENTKPFAQDIENKLYVKLKLGSMLHAGTSSSTTLTVQLPVGYVCRAAATAPANLKTFELAGMSPETRGELSAGVWSFSGADCTYNLAVHSAIYGGSTIVCQLTVDNPHGPVGTKNTANSWYVRVSGAGDASSTLSLTTIPDVEMPSIDNEVFPRNVAVLGQLTEISITPTNFWWAAANNFIRVFFRTAQSSGSSPAVLLLQAPDGFGFYEYCQVHDLPDDHYAPIQGIYTSLTSEVYRLGPSTCRASWVAGAIGMRPSLSSITTKFPIEADRNYAFSMRIFHPRFYAQSQRLSFVLTTCAGDESNLLDRSPHSMPVLEATSGYTYPSYGLCSLESQPSMFQMQISDLIPYQHSKTAATVKIRLRPPLDGNSTDATVQEYSRLVSWRVFAPLGYAWRFSDRTFLCRLIDNIEGITRSLPIRRKPVAPLFPPRNVLDFPGSNENLIGWEASQVYGFDTFIHVPPETPRSAVNEWIVEWGYDMPVLWRRVTAVSAAAGVVRALHSFYVRSLVTKLMGTNNELLFQFGTTTTIPQQIGALVIEAPTNFVFQAACSTTAPTVSYLPYRPVPALLDCVSATMESLHAEGLLRPRITLRPLDVDIPLGMWTFSLSCVNPISAEVSKFSADTFILHSFINHEENVVADVAAVTDGFKVMSAMTSATIVNPASYTLIGRDDHPGQSSNIVIAFELRTAPLDSGSLIIGVQAPDGFEFEPRCKIVIGDGVFGVGQPYAPPYVSFDAGVIVLSCTGYKHFASVQVTPGLKKGKHYAFRMRIDQQPQFTPVPNQWRLTVGAEQSEAIFGFRLWAFSGMSLSMTQTSRLNPAALVENVVELTFVPANTITVKGMVIVIAPVDYKIRFDCTAEVYQLAADRITTTAQIPNTVCKGEQPPTNRAEIKFQSEVAAIVRGYPYRLSFQVSNPLTIPLFVGRWVLQSYEVATEEPDWSSLSDVGSILSIPITDFFLIFIVRIPVEPSLSDLVLTLELDFSLPHEIAVDDMVMITAPDGFNFALMVADPLLEGDFRRCIYFLGSPASSSLGVLPKPLCAGNAIKFHFRERHDAGSRFRFQATSEWPRVTLLPLHMSFKARHDRQETALATSVAYLTPITPRLLYFQLDKIGARADAVLSSGTVRLSFQTSQAAQFVSIFTRVRGLEFTLGARFNNASAEVNTAGQVLKDVLVVHDGDTRLLLAFDLLLGSKYSLIVRNVRNPDVISTVLWSVMTFAKPKPPGRLATPADGEGLTATIAPAAVLKAPHLSTPEEVLVWTIDDNLRDEILEFPAPPTVGLIEIYPNEAILRSAFFDFTATVVTLTFSVMPRKVPSGSRLLVFAPDDWTFVPNSFTGDSFPFEDIGIMQCLDTATIQMHFIYAVRLLNDIRASAPCLFNPGQICVYKNKFSLAVNTPQTPNDLERWRRESEQAWLLIVDSHGDSGCGPSSGQIDPGVMLFTNDALFSGFLLKESMGRMVVLPAPNGQMSRQHSTIAVEFETRSVLQLTPEQLARGNLAIYLRLETVLGLEFRIGCLAAVPDPDYFSCIGYNNLAIVRVRENTFATGEHRVVVQAVNPVVTPSENTWMLESFVGVTFEEARIGAFYNVRQRGRAPGYPIWQHLVAEMNPASSQRSANTLIFLWFRPSVFVEALGTIEIHAAQSFDMSCIPPMLLISMPIVSCKSYLDTSGVEFADLHYVVEIEISNGNFLLPNKAYELAVNVRNPEYVREPAAGTSKDWGLRLRNARKEVLEANMQIGYYNVTNYGIAVVSIIPSATARYAKNEVRMIMQFSRRISLTAISEIRIVAPIGWDFRPLCARYEDVTGGRNQKHLQLPYSDEKGHHSCPQANVLMLLLDQNLAIEAGVYTLLIGVMNPAAAPPRNFWKVGLLSPADNLGWTPDQEANEVFEEALRPGQEVLVETWSMGFVVGERQGSNTQEPSPLRGVYSEVLSNGAAKGCMHMLLHFWICVASITTVASMMLVSS